MVGQMLFYFMLGIPCGPLWRTSRIITLIWIVGLIGYAVGTGERIYTDNVWEELFCWVALMVGYVVGYFAKEIEACMFSKGVGNGT